MVKTHQAFLHSCIALMVKPIANFCLSRGLRFQDFTELTKKNFVLAAERQLRREGKEISYSRISIMTGLQRPEVKRLLDEDVEPTAKDIVTRLLGQWERDKRFLDGRGNPKPLSTRGTKSEFARLVKLVSKDLNAHTVRFELERLGLVTVKNERARLQQPEHIVQGDPQHALRFGAEDVADLLQAVEENAFLVKETPNLHARTQYDNIPDEYIPKIRESLLTLGKKFHAQARSLLASFDKDINPNVSKRQGRNRVVVGTFSVSHTIDGNREED